MPTIYGDTDDGNIYHSNSNWVTARDAATGSTATTTSTSNAFAIRGGVTAGRGGGNVYNISRVFIPFDTSGIVTTVDRAVLSIYGYANGGGNLMVVQATSNIAALSVGDYDEITGWDGSSSDGSGGGDNLNNVTRYSDQITTWSTSGYNEIPLTGKALKHMVENDDLFICIINYTHDLRDMVPIGYDTHRNGMYFSDNTGTSKDPKIDYTINSPMIFGCNF